MAVIEGSSYLTSYPLMHSFTDPLNNFTSIPFLSFSLEGAPDLLLNPRKPPTQQQAHPLTQTDSPVSEAHHGEDHHDQDLLF